jgi:hypothetical protein
MNLIRPDQFNSVLATMTDRDTVYVVPSFQRPYAWTSDQIGDLLRDIEKASSKGVHYLSSLHLIPINLGKTDEALAEYIDLGPNQDLELLRKRAQNDELQTQAHVPVQVYAVVDGQQRLTTLFLLAHIYAALQQDPDFRSALNVRLHGGPEVPRLIQNPPEDHEFMKSLILMIFGARCPPVGRQSQQRMLDNVVQMHKWATVHPTELKFLSSSNFKASAIELEEGYGLISFLTLNDRGKPLTVLEKLKSLLLQFASDAHNISLIRDLHGAFGDLYQGDAGDSEMVRLLSCYLRLSKDRAAIWDSAEVAYDRFFRAQLLADQTDAPRCIEEWCNGIREVGIQLSYLNRYLDWARSLGDKDPSLHFTDANLRDDYRVVLLSLKLQPHLLALLLKFRAKFNRDWHERFQHIVSPPSPAPIRALLDDTRKREGAAAPQALTEYINTLANDNAQVRSSLSMLEVVERIQMLNWNLGSRRHGGFVGCCQTTFSMTDPAKFVGRWAAFQTADAFIQDLLYGFTEPNVRYLLMEYERSLGQNLHFGEGISREISTGPIELEHVFAQSVDQDDQFNAMGGFETFHIGDRLDFDRNLLYRTGNFTWLSKVANDMLGNKPPDYKATHYRQCDGHGSNKNENVCPKINITKKIGQDLSALGGNYGCFRLYIESRCAELALFAVRRFC